MKTFDKKAFEKGVKRIIETAKNSDYKNKEEALSDIIEDYIEKSPKDLVYLASLIDYLNDKGIDESKIDPRDVMVVDNFSTLDFLAGKSIEMIYLYCLKKMMK